VIIRPASQTGLLDARLNEVREVSTGSGSAFASLMSQMQVDAGGVSAKITDFSATKADLDGYAAAFTGLSAQVSNGQVASIKLTSFADPDGSGGATIDMSGDVIAPGTISTNKVAVGLQQNLLYNHDWVDDFSGWFQSGTGLTNSETVVATRAIGSSWAGVSYPTMGVHQVGTSTDGYTDITSRDVDNTGAIDKGTPVSPNEDLSLSVRVSTHRCTAKLYAFFYDAANAWISVGTGNGGGPSSRAIPTNTSSSTDPRVWPLYYINVKAPANAAYVRLAVRKNGTNAGSNDSWVFLHEPMLARSHADATGAIPYSPQGTTFINGGRLVNDSVETASLVAKDLAALNMVVVAADIASLSADVIDAGEMGVAHLKVDETLEVDSDTGAIAFGKTGMNQDAVDGLYVGRRAGGGFAIDIGGVDPVSGLQQGIRKTDTSGLEIVNATYQKSPPTAAVTSTTSQTLTLPATATRLSLQVLGGGAGGDGSKTGYSGGSPAENLVSNPGSAGGATTVVLKDGTTTIATWTATGGAPSTQVENMDIHFAYGSGWYVAKGAKGEASLYGTGGGATPTTGVTAPPTGYGAGGGGARSYNAPGLPNSYYDANSGFYYSAKGGGAGQIITIENYDISALADPKLVITIGAGGTAGAGNSGTYPQAGSAGGAGYVAGSYIDGSVVGAGVLPHSPSAQGTFTTAVGVSKTLPDVGEKGLWIIWPTTLTYLGFRDIDAGYGNDISATYTYGFMTFLAEKRPIIPNPNYAQTVRYAFFSLE
jgi:hypothetical protein